LMVARFRTFLDGKSAAGIMHTLTQSSAAIVRRDMGNIVSIRGLVLVPAWPVAQSPTLLMLRTKASLVFEHWRTRPKGQKAAVSVISDLFLRAPVLYVAERSAARTSTKARRMASLRLFRTAFGYCAVPHNMNDPKSLYQSPSGASGSVSTQFLSCWSSENEIDRFGHALGRDPLNLTLACMPGRPLLRRITGRTIIWVLSLSPFPRWSSAQDAH
jgi:hypothetical protein